MSDRYFFKFQTRARTHLLLVADANGVGPRALDGLGVQDKVRARRGLARVHHAHGADDGLQVLQGFHAEGQGELDLAVVAPRDGRVDERQQLLRVDQGDRAVFPEARVRLLRRASDPGPGGAKKMGMDLIVRVPHDQRRERARRRGHVAQEDRVAHVAGRVGVAEEVLLAHVELVHRLDHRGLARAQAVHARRERRQVGRRADGREERDAARLDHRLDRRALLGELPGEVDGRIVRGREQRQPERVQVGVERVLQRADRADRQAEALGGALRRACAAGVRR